MIERAVALEAQEDIFLLRPHHLKYLIELAKGRSISGIVDWMVDDTQPRFRPHDDDVSTLSVYDSLQSYEAAGNSTIRQAYAADVLGSNGAHIGVYRTGIQTTLETFQGLKPEAPVMLGLGVLDGICNSCAFGRHCLLTKPQGVRNDSEVMGLFTFIAEHDVEESTILLTDGALITDAQTTRSVAQNLANSGRPLDVAASTLHRRGDSYLRPSNNYL